MKREKYTVCEFWIEPVICSFKNLVHSILEQIGYWECKECGKTLSPRVKKFKKEHVIGGLGNREIVLHIEVCSKCKE